MDTEVKSSQVVGLRDRVAIIRALLNAISCPPPYAGYGALNGVGRRRNLSEAACYRNWPRSRWLRYALTRIQERMVLASVKPPPPARSAERVI